MTTPASVLIGCWLLASSGGAEERVEVQFKLSGELVYATLVSGTWSIMLLTYRVEGSQIVSNQPSAPKEEKTEFSFQDTDNLVLSFGGEQGSYTRIAACTFPAPKQTSTALVARLRRWLS